MSTGNSPGNKDRHGMAGAKAANGVYLVIPAVTGRVKVKAIACTSCGAEANHSCVVKAGPRAGLPTDTYHPERVRMANRLRNEAIARGEEQVHTSNERKPQADRGHGVSTCPECEHQVPLTASGRLRSHSLDGGRNSVHSIPCMGSGIRGGGQ